MCEQWWDQPFCEGQILSLEICLFSKLVTWCGKPAAHGEGQTVTRKRLGFMMEQSLRLSMLSKYGHHSHLLQVVNIEPVSHGINTQITNLFAKTMSVSSVSITVYLPVFTIKAYLHWNHCKRHITQMYYFMWGFPNGSFMSEWEC